MIDWSAIRRKKLPDSEEITAIEAIFWLATGRSKSLEEFHADEDARDHRSNELANRIFTCEKHLGIARLTTLPRSDLIFELYPFRHQLSDITFKMFRALVKAESEARIRNAVLREAASELISTAASGAISVRAKRKADEVFPQRIDAAYFRNQIEFDWLTGGFDSALGPSDPGFWEDLNLDKYKLYSPLIRVDQIHHKYRTRNPNFELLMVTADSWANRQDHSQDARWFRQDLIAELEHFHMDASDNLRNEVASAFGRKHPGRFKRGRRKK